MTTGGVVWELPPHAGRKSRAARENAGIRDFDPMVAVCRNNRDAGESLPRALKRGFILNALMARLKVVPFPSRLESEFPGWLESGLPRGLEAEVLCGMLWSPKSVVPTSSTPEISNPENSRGKEDIQWAR